MKLLLTLFITLLLTTCDFLFGVNSLDEIRDSCALAYYQYAQAEVSKGKQGFPKAIKFLNMADSIEPQNAVILHERGLIKFSSRQDNEGAFKDLELSIEYSMDENDKLTRYHNRGLCYYQIGELDKACADWSKAGESGEVYIEKYCNK
ncbi:MAG: hypothetical protein R2852_09525 [Bacteroidia bacterium]